MTIAEVIHGYTLPPQEAEVLVAAALGKGRTWVLAHEDGVLSDADEQRCRSFLDRRRSGEPVAYITGAREFYGRPFRVTPDVLIPRPATETLVEAALDALRGPFDGVRDADAGIAVVSRILRPDRTPACIVDCGTGSGCIAVTLALEQTGLPVIATDISPAALAIAQENAVHHGVARRIDFRLGSLLDPVECLREPFLLVSNPPYVPEDALLPSDVRHGEPRTALFGGGDGCAVLRRLVSAARAHPFCAGILLECQTDQIGTIGLDKPKKKV